MSAPPPELFPANSTFKRINSLKFIPPENSDFVAVEDQTAHWYLQLRENKASGLRVAISPKEFQDHKDGTWGFYSGQVPCAVRVDFPSGPIFWFPKWVWNDPVSPKVGRTWKAEYTPGRNTDFVSLETHSLEESVSKLRDALQSINRFALENGIKSWSAVFEQALAITNSSDASTPDLPDLIPESGEESRRLIAAGVRSWVFGGMGWWNDLGPFSNPITARTYRLVTEQLYSAVIAALIVGANSCTIRTK